MIRRHVFVSRVLYRGDVADWIGQGSVITRRMLFPSRRVKPSSRLKDALSPGGVSAPQPTRCRATARATLRALRLRFHPGGMTVSADSIHRPRFRPSRPAHRVHRASADYRASLRVMGDTSAPSLSSPRPVHWSLASRGRKALVCGLLGKRIRWRERGLCEQDRFPTMR